MKFVWKPFLLVAVLSVLLAGCGKSVTEQVTEGLADVEATFNSPTFDPTEEVGELEVYMPAGYHINKGSVDLNYIVTKGDESFILFVNELEAADSQLHYNNFINEDVEVVKEETFSTEDEFAFAAVVKQTEEQYELVVASGGVKMTTISDAKKIDRKLQAMMEIVRSVQVKQ